MARNNNNEINITFKAFNKNFNSAIKEMDDQTKQLRQEMKLQEEQMKHTASSTDKLEAKLNSLQQIYDVQRRKTQETSQALEQAKQIWGESSQEVAKLEAQLKRHQIAEQQAANSITETRQALQRAQKAQEQQATSLTQLNRLFDATGTSVDQFADELGSDLVNAIQQGRASATQLDSAFNQVSRSALGANTDLNQVQQTLRTLDSGSSIADVRQELGRLQQEANQAQEGVQDLGNELQALGGILAGAGIAGAIAKALDVDDLKAKIDVTFDVPESSNASIRKALADVKKYGVDGEEALEGLRRQFALNKEASDETNASIVRSAAAIAYAYNGIDFTELIQETNEIGKELKISDEEALDLVNSLLRIGFPPEQLDIIAEYGSQLRRAGYEAKEIKGILAAASGVNSWNIDNLLDGLKEGRIKATEMGRGLSESFKDNLRDVVGSTNKASEEQISAMETNFANQERSLSKSLSRRYDAISKSYEKQKKVLQKSLEQQYEAAEDSYEDKEEALEKSLESEYEAQVKSYEKSLEKIEKSLDQEVKAFEKASNERIALIDKEYNEKLKLIDEEKYRQIKAIEDQINNINKVSAAEEKIRKYRENASKRSELQEKIRTAKDAKSKQEAYKELKDFDELLRVEKIKEERQAQIDALKDEKDSINEAYDEKKEALKEETENRKEETKNAIEVEKEALSERQAAEKKAFIESNKERLKLLKENQTAELNNFREVNAEKLNALREEHQSRQELLNERLSTELSAVQESHQAQLESYRAMNQQKMELAKNPPDTAEFKAIEQQLEDWGTAIAKGGEEGSQAFEDMVRWLNSIEDATLQNAIGVELFGTMWEDQGQNIIDSVLNADDALKELEKTEQSVSDTASQIGETSGLVQLREATENLIVALDPLFNLIADVVGALTNWASNNPKITAAIVAIGSAIGILIGAFAAIGPALLGIVALFGGGTGGAGLLGIFSKIGPVILGLATKVLPALRIAFGVLTGPVGIAITILTTAVPLIIKHWDSISEFFSKLFSGIWEGIKKFGQGVVEFFKQWGPSILAILTGPLGLLVQLVIKNWDTIKAKTSEIFGRVRDITRTIFESLHTHTIGKIVSLKDRAVEIFGRLKDGITRPIEKARDAIKSAIDKIKSFFNFNFKWPELKMPKFKVKKGSLNPMKWFSEGFPEIDIQWFANGGVMTRPTLFGGSGNTAFVGGEAGPEAVLPLNERVLGAIGNAIYAATGKDISGQQTVYNFEKMLDGAVFHVREEADIKKIARELGDYTKVRERGGRR